MEMKSEVSGSCCTIKGSKRGPVTEVKLVTPVITIDPVIDVVPFVALASPDSATVTDASPPAFSDCQARLCTFQI
jgi:hypothetical protein